ncbi:MAG: NFACT RNA binding domain-containing protein [Clostridiales Family XIII bacterium]|jgi:predicted ribosome quality control (RQC) complex YloA/Tae2 family protein|nr:NFACT RNA binding domain-containing protein [Clostridiales Family XIII bacterium]
MAFDYYVVGAVARELAGRLVGGRVERVYQPGRADILLLINRPPSGGRPAARENLFLSADSSQPAFYLTDSREAGPDTPPAFCMLLRKHLVGARILSVSQAARERIVRIELEASSELGLKTPRALIFELMGKHSNLILTDNRNNNPDEEKILDAVKRISFDKSRVRQVLPGLSYTLPPPGKGVSPLMEAETAPGGPPLAHYDALAQEGAYAPTIWYDGEGKAKDFHVFPLKIMEGLRAEPFESASAMLQTWYENRESAARVSEKAKETAAALKARLDKLYLKKQRLLEEIEKAKHADAWKRKGDLLTANIWRLEKGMKEASLEDWEQEGAPPVAIALDPLLTPAENAQKYYKKYGKEKTAAVEKEKQREEADRLIAYLESAAWALEAAQTPADVAEIRDELTEAGILRNRAKAKPQKKGKKGGLHKAYFAPIEYTLPSGSTVYVGRNNRENDELTMRFANPDDLWLHTKDIPGSHVILKQAPSAKPTEDAQAQDIRAAAGIAAYHSKGRASEGVPVDYTKARHVKKPTGAKPGYVIFTNNKTLYVTPKLPREEA